MEVAAVRVVRWVVLGALVFLTGATLGFVASLLRQRTYADFAGSVPGAPGAVVPEATT